MTPEKTYQLVCEMMQSYDSASGTDAASKVISNPSDFLRCFNPFYESAAALLLDAKTRMDKKVSSASVVSAVKRMVKAAVAGHNRLLQGMVYQHGLYCVCDSNRIVRLHDDVTSVPHIENTPATPDLAKLVKPAADANFDKLDLPAESDLKAYIARCKAAAGNSYTYSYQLAENVFVNPQYLLDMLQALPGCECFIDPDKAGKGMIYFAAENGDGVLLPVNPGTAHII